MDHQSLLKLTRTQTDHMVWDTVIDLDIVFHLHVISDLNFFGPVDDFYSIDFNASNTICGTSDVSKYRFASHGFQHGCYSFQCAVITRKLVICHLIPAAYVYGFKQTV